MNDDFTEESGSGEDKCGIHQLPTATGGSQRVLKFSSPDDSPPILVMTVKIDHGDPLVLGGGTAGRGQGEGSSFLKFLDI